MSSRRVDRPTSSRISPLGPCAPAAPFACLLAALLLAGAARVGADSMVAISTTDPTLVNDSAGGYVRGRADSLSDDGRYLVFFSVSPDLVAGDSGSEFTDTFLFDRVSGDVTLVSAAAGNPGQGGFGYSSNPVISADGELVVFESQAVDLAAPGSGFGASNIYLWERATGSLTLVSHAASDPLQPGDSSSDSAVLSADGAFVAFASYASDLVGGATGPFAPNVYLWERASGAISLVSHVAGSPLVRTGGAAQHPEISADGSRVAYRSIAPDLVAGATGPSHFNVYVWERATGTNTLISHAAVDPLERGDAATGSPSIDASGTRVAYASTATNLTPFASGPSGQNAYLWESGAMASMLLSHAVGQPEQRGNAPSEPPVLAGNGGYVAFSSAATDLVAGATGPAGDNVYLWERVTETTALVSHAPGAPLQRASGASSFPATSDDGSHVAYASTATNLVVGTAGPASYNVYVWQRTSATTTLVSHADGSPLQRGESSSGAAALSGDGSQVAFRSFANDLVANDHFFQDVFLAETTSATPVLVSRRDPGSPWQPMTSTSDSHLASPRFAAISADGDAAVFVSASPDLVVGQSGPLLENIYYWQRATGAATLVSHAAAALLQRADALSADPTISPDGAFVTFVSDATDLVAGPGGPAGTNLYSWERSTGAVTLISHAAGDPLLRSDGNSENAVLSSDGSRVAFLSDASDLVPGPSTPPFPTSVYVWDRATNVVTLVSHAAGDPLQVADNHSNDPWISGDGSSVVFWSAATDLVAGASGPIHLNTYLWDAGSNTTTLVSRAAGSPLQRADQDCWDARVDTAGGHVLFTSAATDLIVGATGPTHLNVYLWERPSGAVTLVSHAVGAALQRGDGSSEEPRISADGAFVAFVSSASDLIEGGASWPTALGQVYLWEQASGSISLVSHTAGSPLALTATNAEDPAISSDGAFVAYVSPSNDLVPGHDEELSGDSHVFRWERATGKNTLVSHSWGAPLRWTHDSSREPRISPDGVHIAFWGEQPDLVPRDFNRGTSDAFVWTGWASDVDAPTPPAIGSTSPAPGVWSHADGVEVFWSGAADEAGGSGLEGYSLLFDHGATTPADGLVDIGHGPDPQLATSDALADGDDWYFHVAACDQAGNCSASVHAGPFWIDTAVPSSPGAVASPSHDFGPSNDDTIDVEWGAATDDGSGIASYRYVFSTSATPSDCAALALTTAATALSSASLAEGAWYLHVCAEDLAGNRGGVVSGGPYRIDTSGPSVASLDSVPEAGLGGAAPEVGVALDRFLVGFDEAMAEKGPGAVTDVANWRLFEAGADGALDSTECGPPGDDDVLFEIAAVVYDAGNALAGVNAGEGFGLAAGRYRLMGCATLVDLAGNPLQGGLAPWSAAWTTDLDVAVSPLAANPNFDADLAAWRLSGPQLADFGWQASDAELKPLSGSLALETLSGVGEWRVAQCVELGEAGDHAFRALVRLASASAGEPAADLEVLWHRGAFCTGDQIGGGTSAAVQGDSAGLWRPLALPRLDPPVGAVSALIAVQLASVSIAEFAAGVDRLFFGRLPALLADGFESGDTCQWSSTAGGPICP